MSEIRYQTGFDIDYFAIRIFLFEQLGYCFGGLASFNQLPIDKAPLFIFRKPRGAGQPGVFFRRYHTIVEQEFPKF